MRALAADAAGERIPCGRPELAALRECEGCGGRPWLIVGLRDMAGGGAVGIERDWFGQTENLILPGRSSWRIIPLKKQVGVPTNKSAL
jgi:hypothetical protein